MSWICSKSDFPAEASEVEPEAAVRRSHVGLCVVTEGLRRESVEPEGQVGDGSAIRSLASSSAPALCLWSQDCA